MRSQDADLLRGCIVLRDGLMLLPDWFTANDINAIIRSTPRAGFGEKPEPKSNLVHFSLKIRHLVATTVMIFPESQSNIIILDCTKLVGLHG